MSAHPPRELYCHALAVMGREKGSSITVKSFAWEMTQEFYFLCMQSTYVPATKVLEMEPRVPQTLGKYSTAELCPMSSVLFLVLIFFVCLFQKGSC